MGGRRRFAHHSTRKREDQQTAFAGPRPPQPAPICHSRFSPRRVAFHRRRNSRTHRTLRAPLRDTSCKLNNLAKVDVEGSSPFARSNQPPRSVSSRATPCAKRLWRGQERGFLRDFRRERACLAGAALISTVQGCSHRLQAFLRDLDREIEVTGDDFQDRR